MYAYALLVHIAAGVPPAAGRKLDVQININHTEFAAQLIWCREEGEPTFLEAPSRMFRQSVSIRNVCTPLTQRIDLNV